MATYVIQNWDAFPTEERTSSRRVEVGRMVYERTKNRQVDQALFWEDPLIEKDWITMVRSAILRGELIPIDMIHAV